MGSKFIAFLVLVIGVLVMPATAAEPPVPRNDGQLDGTRPGATPAERPLRPFAGWLTVTGCKFRVDGSFIGRVQEGAISGMAAEGSNFNWPISDDGRFAGEIRLRVNTDGVAVHQWVEGRVEEDRLIVDVAFGVPGDPDSVCRGVEQTVELGG